MDFTPTTVDTERNDIHPNFSSHNATTATNTDIMQKTAKTKQDVENAVKRNTPAKNATAPRISAANATENTRHGTITAQPESPKPRDSRRSGDKFHQFMAPSELMN